VRVCLCVRLHCVDRRIHILITSVICIGAYSQHHTKAHPLTARWSVCLASCFLCVRRCRRRWWSTRRAAAAATTGRPVVEEEREEETLRCAQCASRRQLTVRTLCCKCRCAGAAVRRTQSTNPPKPIRTGPTQPAAGARTAVRCSCVTAKPARAASRPSTGTADLLWRRSCARAPSATSAFAAIWARQCSTRPNAQTTPGSASYVCPPSAQSMIQAHDDAAYPALSLILSPLLALSVRLRVALFVSVCAGVRQSSSARSAAFGREVSGLCPC
jgi:hypothetical protein